MGYYSDIYNNINGAKSYSELADARIPEPSILDRLTGNATRHSYPELMKYRDEKLNQLRDTEFAPVLNQYKTMVDHVAKEDPSKLPIIANQLPQFLENHPIAAKFKSASKNDPGYNSYMDIMRNYVTNADKQVQVNQALQRYDAGTDTADDRITLTQNYGDKLDNVLKPHAERRAYNQDMAFLDKYAQIEPQKYNNLSEATAAYIQAAREAGKQLKPEDVDRFRNSNREYWEKVKVGGPKDSTIKVGPVTETTRLQSYALGDDKNVGAPARYDATEAITADAASRQARTAELALDAEERKSADEKISHLYSQIGDITKEQLKLDPKTDTQEWNMYEDKIKELRNEIPKWEKARQGYKGDKKKVRPSAEAGRGRVVRTGTDASGRKVVQYEDGSLDYAK